MSARRYDIDWLRVFSMLAVFVYHCSRFFDSEGWHLKNAEQSNILFLVMRALIWPWIMELFFLLSGVGAWYALKPGRAGAYLWERVKRLLIPLYTVGLFVLLPPQYYFEILTNAGYKGSFFEMIPRYFALMGPPHLTGRPGSLLPVPFTGHLWFLQYLFLISLATLPLLVFLKSDRGRRFIGTLAAWCERPGGVFLFLIPLALALIGLRCVFEAQRSWADFVWYAIYFLIGYMVAADGRFTNSFRRHGWVCLGLWLVGFGGGIIPLISIFGYKPLGHQTFSMMYVLFQVIWSIAGWSSVVFMLSMGARYLNFNHRALVFSDEAVLPFYLFHQTILLVVGFFIIPLNMGILPKFLAIAVISFPLIMAMYGLLIRPFRVMRFFFGMRPPADSPAAGPAGTGRRSTRS